MVIRLNSYKTIGDFTTKTFLVPKPRVHSEVALKANTIFFHKCILINILQNISYKSNQVSRAE